MRIKKIEIVKYKNFENIVIDFDKNDSFPDIFSIASKNGGGKSTLLQFIFILLHCMVDDSKKKYIKNLLNVFRNITKDLEFVKFLITDDENQYFLNFQIVKSNSSELNFDIYLDIKDTKRRIHQYQDNLSKYREIIQLQKDLQSTDRLTPVIERNIRHITPFIESTREEDLYHHARKSRDIIVYKELVNSIIDKNSITENGLDELKLIDESLKHEKILLEGNLNLNNLKYITHLDSKNVILLKSDIPEESLIKLSNKVFLTAPSSQIFLFLSENEKHTIFNDFSSQNHSLLNESWHHESYSDILKRAKQELNGFFTYDFASTELILESFRRASEEDLKTRRKTGKYGVKYDELTDELKDFLDGKEITENEDGNRIIIKSKVNGKNLSPEDLSHGELKKLGIYIWLKYIVEEDSIILMDEVDIALHPKWQYELVRDLTKWSCNSEFLLATHSPQIMSSTYYKNIIKLDNGQVKRYTKPPIDRDINAIIMEVMESPNFPEDLLKLHKSYRSLINEGKKDTEEGKSLKAEILEYESENSSFFQEINFDLEIL